MTVKTQYRPVTIDHLDRSAWPDDGSSSSDGLPLVACELYAEQVDDLEDDHPAGLAFQDVVDEAIEEVNDQIRDLVADAIERRLPWRWEPAKITSGGHDR